MHLGQISKKWHDGWLILTIFHQMINQNYGYFPHIELSVVPCCQYGQFFESEAILIRIHRLMN